MTDFDAAEKAANALARRLVKQGRDPGVVADAFAASALAMFAAYHNAPLAAREMLAAWASIRSALDG